MSRRVALLMLVPLLLAQGAPATQSAEAELARLRAENARLREELAATKAQLADKATRPAATVPSKPRVFGTMLELLANTPMELRPQVGVDWRKFTESKLLAWWEGELTGMTFDQTMVFYKTDTFRSITQRPGAEWTINPILFESKPFVYFGAEHTWQIVISQIYGDEAAAKKWDATKPGAFFRVKGVVATAEVTRAEYDSRKLPVYKVILRLRDVEIGAAK